MDMFIDLRIFNPHSALVHLKTEAYQHQHILPRIPTLEAIESKKRKKYLVGHFTASGE